MNCRWLKSYSTFDKLKSATRGYGTLDYDFVGYEAADLVKLDILVSGKRVDALTTITHRKDADVKGRKLVKKLKNEISRHLFEVVLQAAIGSRIIARESIRPMAKKRNGQMLRRRYYQETKTPGKAERGQEENEVRWQRGNPTEGVFSRAFN